MLFSQAEPVEGNVTSGSILNLDQWFRRCCLKTFLRALAAPLFSGAEPFVQFW